MLLTHVSLFALISDVPVSFFSRVSEVCISVYNSVCSTVTMLRPCTELETIMPLLFLNGKNAMYCKVGSV